MSDYAPTGVINDRPRPRVLVWTANGHDEYSKFAWLDDVAPTIRWVREVDEVDLSEWDVLVTDEAHADTAMPAATSTRSARTPWRVPENLFVFRVFDRWELPRSESFFEFDLNENGSADVRNTLRHTIGVPGHQFHRVSSLPEPIRDLVSEDLVGAGEARDKQFGFRKTSDQLSPGIIDFRPFLIGPSGMFLAGSYQRPAGKSVWLLPSDVSRLADWYEVAISEWHVSDPRTFPGVVTWQTASAWDTANERDARATLQSLTDAHSEAITRYQADRAIAEARLAAASEEARLGPKVLLSGQDDPLQQAVLEALRHLGFDVRDMDAEWPERERREDYRISDPEEPDWLVLGDATGVAKGAQGSKITAVVGYATKYVLEERPDEIPGVWIVVNRLINRDPTQRGDIYREDDRNVLIDNKGLALDSAALYVLTQAISSGSDRAVACRTWLRRSRGQVTVTDAIEWLEANP